MRGAPCCHLTTLDTSLSTLPIETEAAAPRTHAGPTHPSHTWQTSCDRVGRHMRGHTALLTLAACAVSRAELQLKTSWKELPSDSRGDEDNISPPISWSGQPKNTESFVMIMDSSTGNGEKPTTHWLIYDIPKEVMELREELSGAGASSVSRLGMKDDAGQAPVVSAPPGPSPCVGAQLMRACAHSLAGRRSHGIHDGWMGRSGD